MREGDNWCPVIDLESGTILHWPKGVTADIHYKVCDEGSYSLLDAEMKEVAHRFGYVPDIMCPGGTGYGDYVIMNIDGAGKIEGWTIDLSDWEGAE